MTYFEKDVTEEVSRSRGSVALCPGRGGRGHRNDVLISDRVQLQFKGGQPALNNENPILAFFFLCISEIKIGCGQGELLSLKQELLQSKKLEITSYVSLSKRV